MAAKHLIIAREQGVEAGMEAYMSAPISKQHDLYKEITKKRTPATKLAAYCKAYGFDSKAAPVVVEADPQAAVLVALFEALGLTTPEKPSASTATPTKGAKPKTGRKVKASTGTITAGQAWEALGGGAEYEPSDPSKPANNGQLWRLNVQGLIKLA